MLGVCGDDCASCPRLAATEANDVAELERLRDFWVRLGWRPAGFAVDAMRCDGCRPDQLCAHVAERDCAFGKGLNNCGECASFPCASCAAMLADTEARFAGLAGRCSPAELRELVNAYFSKRENLVAVHARMRDVADGTTGP